MDSPTALLASSVGLSFLGLFLLKRIFGREKTAPFPPGPPGLPVIGNLLEWPKEKECATFTRWRDRYGDMVHCRLLRQHIVLITSPQLCAEMLEKKGAIYSSRPYLYFPCEMVGWDRSTALAPYGQHLRDMRRLMAQEVGSQTLIGRFVPMQEREVHKFLGRMMAAPSWDRLSGHIRKLVTSITFQVSHGYPVIAGDDPMVGLVEGAMREVFASFLPGTYLVNAIPALDLLPSWFPGTGFKKDAARMRKTRTDMANIPYNWVKQQIAAGKAQPSFIATQLAKGEMKPEDEEVVKYAGTSLYPAGVEAIVTCITAFFLTMTLFPEVQARAQAEIDSVTGGTRLPTLADRPNLPYVEAVCKEVYRWATILTHTPAHMSTADDVHAGYFIPKGTYVIPNVGAMLYDPATYPDPAAFHPARFLAADGHAPEQDPKEYVFGFGRRVCPGALFADATFVAAAMMSLAVFDVAKSVGNDGKVIEPSVAFASGFFHCPKPFECTIKPRSAKAGELIREAAEQVLSA